MKLQVSSVTMIQEASQQLENLWGELKNVQHDDPEERWRHFKICLLLNALPMEYDHVTSSLYEKADLTFDNAVK